MGRDPNERPVIVLYESKRNIKQNRCTASVRGDKRSGPAYFVDVKNLGWDPNFMTEYLFGPKETSWFNFLSVHLFGLKGKVQINSF